MLKKQMITSAEEFVTLRSSTIGTGKLKGAAPFDQTPKILEQRMIQSAEEFITLRSSALKSEYDRAAMEEAPIAVWREIIIKHPNYRRWVAHNKTVPLEILEELCTFDSTIRQSVARKRKLSLAMFETLSRDLSDVVRVAIAANRKTPVAILERLLTDQDADVVSVARLNLDDRKTSQ